MTIKRQSYHPIQNLKYAAQGVLNTESVDEILKHGINTESVDEILKRDCSDKSFWEYFPVVLFGTFMMSWLKVLTSHFTYSSKPGT